MNYYRNKSSAYSKKSSAYSKKSSAYSKKSSAYSKKSSAYSKKSSAYSKKSSAYYHSLITDKSWQILQNLKSRFDFILIGGWAVYLYTQNLKSKDIDIIIDYENLAEIKSELLVTKTPHLSKYEARDGEIQIDIYIPYYSNPGLPAEDLLAYSTTIAGFKTISKEVLAVLKQKALGNRFQTVKGKKDLADLLSLWQLSDFNWTEFNKIIRKYKKEPELDFSVKILKSTRSFAELDLNEYAFSKLKKQLLAYLS